MSCSIKLLLLDLIDIQELILNLTFPSCKSECRVVISINGIYVHTFRNEYLDNFLRSCERIDKEDLIFKRTEKLLQSIHVHYAQKQEHSLHLFILGGYMLQSYIGAQTKIVFDMLPFCAACINAVLPSLVPSKLTSAPF